MKKRSELKRLLGKTYCFTATVGSRRRIKRNGRFISLRCFKDIKYKRKPITDHIWLLATRLPQEWKGKLERGNEISFVGTVVNYKRKNGTKDYKIEYVENIELINK